jgi:hypothetical protein
MKKLFNKWVLLILLAILVVTQAPFVYRRYQFGQLSEKIAEIRQQRAPSTPNGAAQHSEGRRFKDYKGVIHVHTNLGGHSTGTFEELIAAANANDLDFVVVTEHWSDAIDTAALTLNGVYGKTLFVGGNEIDTGDGDRFLMIPGSRDAAALRKLPTTAVIEKLHAENRLALVAYPGEFKSWDAEFDGVEVFSLNTNARKISPLTAAFDVIWSFRAYPELVLASSFERPDENLTKFDAIASKRNISLVVGSDAHSNIGFHLFGDDAGNKLVNFKIDDYATILRLARQHVLIDADKPLTVESLIDALRAGRSFIAFDVLNDATGFSFDQCEGDSLCVGTPVESRIVLMKDGQIVSEVNGNSLKYGPFEKGIYRVEAYLGQLGPPFDKMPWIISNPIFVR